MAKRGALIKGYKALSYFNLNDFPGLKLGTIQYQFLYKYHLGMMKHTSKHTLASTKKKKKLSALDTLKGGGAF